MIIVGGRARSGARSHRPAPGPDGFREPCPAGLAGPGVTIAGPAAGNGVVARGHGSIAGSACRLDMRS
jgi:hypothetical protein